MNNKFLLLIVSIFITSSLFAQKLTYADVLKDDRLNTVFNILGTVDGNFLVYKNYQNRHYITSYDKDMKLVENTRLDFLNNRIMNIDFVVYPSRVLAIYQQQRGSIVYCDAAYFDNTGKLLTQPVTVDTSRIGFLAESRIYTTNFSDDRSKILIAKMPREGSYLNIMTKIFDPSLNLLDSARQLFDYDRNRDTYKEFKVSNAGSIAFLRENKRFTANFARDLAVFDKRMGEPFFYFKNIDLMGRRIDDTYLKVDNMNGNYVLAAFALPENRNVFTEIFSAKIPFDTTQVGKISFQSFADSTLSSAVNGRGSIHDAFDRFFIKDMILKRDGSFIVMTEENFTDYRMNNMNRWNRGMFGYDPFMGSSPYYFYDPYYSRYSFYDPYRFNRMSGRDNNLYNSNNVVAFSFDNNLKVEWTNTLRKTQNDVGTETYLSYASAVLGPEVHFLYVANSRNKGIVANTGLMANGNMNRYATLKANNKAVAFMPAFARQVGPKQVVMPAAIRNNITFVKIDF